MKRERRLAALARLCGIDPASLSGDCLKAWRKAAALKREYGHTIEMPPLPPECFTLEELERAEQTIAELESYRKRAASLPA
jgi:hypothetical protein